jgi:hypothetical protein
MSTESRLTELLSQTAITGIDFVYVWPSQTKLDVYFLVSPTQLIGALTFPTDTNLIHIRNHLDVLQHIENPAEIAITSATWGTGIDTRQILSLTVGSPGDFSPYDLFIDSPTLIDPYFNGVPFSFKANCPSDLDCLPAAEECPPDTVVDFPIDYTARDFLSFRGALLDFASQRYPDWQDRLPADAGIMLVEVMSALGDELSYYQDRIAREAYIDTATQRRSVRQLAHLVDYTISDGVAASAWLDMEFSPSGASVTTSIPAGSDVWSMSDAGQQIYFEVGHGLFDNLPYQLDQSRNSLKPYIWDPSNACLPAGSTDMFLENGSPIAAPSSILQPFNDNPQNAVPGTWLLLVTEPTNPAQPIRKQMIRVVEVDIVLDPLMNVNVTHIVWEPEQALQFDFDLTVTNILGNMIPLTAGQTQSAYFIVGKDLDDFTSAEGLTQLTSLGAVRAIERAGRDGTITYRFTLPGSDTNPLVWIAGPSLDGSTYYTYQPDPTKEETIVWLGDDINNATPEVRLTQGSFDGTNWNFDQQWTWIRSLVVNASGSQDTDYTFDDGTWGEVAAFRDNLTEFIFQDYTSGDGINIRFGDGVFGLVPAPGRVFRIDYRLGNGTISNVASGTINNYDSGLVSTGTLAINNPIEATGGVDAQTLDEVRQLAPEAFQAVTYRAVRPEDYVAAAEQLPWVINAAASFRWTGSWISVFATPDPEGTTDLTDQDLTAMENQLDLYRQAGREVIVGDPIYADMDLKIEICVNTDAYPGEVEARVLVALIGRKGIVPVPGYFSPDNFTFGTLLQRSTLEATIANISGVKAVEQICFRRRGWFDWTVFIDMSYDPGMNTIIRVSNDPNHPDEGTINLKMCGGA